MIGKDLKRAVEYLIHGQLVAVPTETVYGLAGNAYDPAAINAIFKVKDRPLSDPLIVHTATIAQLKKIVTDLSPMAQKLLHAFSPGPITLLLPKKKSVISNLVTAGKDRVAVRIPAHPLFQRLLKELPFPLVAPSANPFGYISPTQASHVSQQLGKKIPYILDGGLCRWGLESTIIGFDRATDTPMIYRLGALSLEELQAVIPTTRLVGSPLKATLSSLTPGSLPSHYAPKKPLFLGSIPDLLKKNLNKKIGLLTFRSSKKEDVAYQFELAPKGSLEEAGHNLFRLLRKLDRLPIELILADRLPDEGLGRTINDRLERASWRVGKEENK